jgi:hypothetical protein
MSPFGRPGSCLYASVELWNASAAALAAGPDSWAAEPALQVIAKEITTHSKDTDMPRPDAHLPKAALRYWQVTVDGEEPLRFSARTDAERYMDDLARQGLSPTLGRHDETTAQSDPLVALGA